MSMTDTPATEITVTCAHCGNSWETRAKRGSSAQCPECKATRKITANDRPTEIAEQSSWDDETAYEVEQSDYACPKCKTNTEWTIGHTNIMCPTCGNIYISPSALDRVKTAEKTKAVQIAAQPDPRQEIIDKALIHTNRQTIIDNCQDMILKLSTAELYKGYPGYHGVPKFSDEANVKRYRAIFDSLAIQARTETDHIKLGLIWDAFRNFESSPQVQNLVTNINSELRQFAMRLTSISTRYGRCGWSVTEHGKIVPDNWEDYPQFSQSFISHVTRVDPPHVISSEMLGHTPKAIENVITIPDDDVTEIYIDEADDAYTTLQKQTDPAIWEMWEEIDDWYIETEDPEYKLNPGDLATYPDNPIKHAVADKLERLIDAISEMFPEEKLYCRKVLAGFLGNKGWRIQIGVHDDE